MGVGAAPLQGATARGLARAIVRAADLLILRDEESAAHLAEIGAPTPIRVGADAAWTLLPIPGEQGVRPLSKSSLRSAIWRATATSASGSPPACSRSSTPGSRCGSIRGRCDGDAELAADVVGATRRARADRRAAHRSPAARAGMTGARLVIAQRFHALVAAASAGVPVLAVAHEPKLSGLARRLGQPTVAPDAAPRTFADAVLAALDAARRRRPPRSAASGTPLRTGSGCCACCSRAGARRRRQM